MGNFAAQWVTMTPIMASPPPPPHPSQRNIPTSTLFEGFVCIENSLKREGVSADEVLMVISDELIRSIWEAGYPPLRILLVMIIARLRDLFHSRFNFNHHQTNYPQHHSMLDT